MIVHIHPIRSGQLPEYPMDPEGIAPEVTIPLPLPQALTGSIDSRTHWMANDPSQSE